MRKLALLFLLAGLGVAVIAATALAARGHQRPSGVHGTVWAVERFDGGVNTVTAFDASTGEVRCSATVGKRPIGVAAPRHTGKVYTADERSNQLTVLSKRDCSVQKQIPTGAFPHHVMPSRDGGLLYFGEYGTNKVGVVDTGTDTLAAEWPASRDGLAKTHAIWITRNGEDLYATNEGATQTAMGTLSKLDAGTGAIVWEVPIGIRPSEVLVDHGTAYVTVRNENKVKVLDVRVDAPVQTAEVTIGGQPDTMQLTRDRKTLVVGLRSIPQMALMDTRTLEVRHVTFEGYGISGHQWLTPDGRYTFIALESTVTIRPGAIAMVDNRSGEVLRTWNYPSGPWPHGLVFDRKALR
jgi:DNA-binding beta-propeller fold protein YncE